jgi:hypothetical protein
MAAPTFKVGAFFFSRGSPDPYPRDCNKLLQNNLLRELLVLLKESINLVHKSNHEVHLNINLAEL